MSTQLRKKEDDPAKNVQENLRPPANYVCFRCGISGHFIKKCPSKVHIKRSTGIPRSFMVPVDGPEHKGALLTSSGEYAVPILQYLSYNERKKQEPAIVPQDVQAIKSITEVSRNTHEQDQFPAQPIQRIQVSDRFPGHRNRRRKTLHQNPKRGVLPHEKASFLRHQDYDVTHHEKDSLLRHQEYDAPLQEEGPSVRHQENDLPPLEQIPFLGHQEHYQEYDVAHHEKNYLIQHQEYVPLQEEVPSVRHQDNNVPPLDFFENSLLQPQEIYQQFNMSSPKEVPLYQEYNVPPYEKDYFSKLQEYYQSLPHQISIEDGCQSFPLQLQSPGTSSINDSHLPLPPGDALSNSLLTNDVSVFKSLPFESEHALTNQEEKNGSALLGELQRKLDKLYRKYARGKTNSSRSTEGHESGSLSQSRSSKSWTQAVSKSPTRTSDSRSPQQDEARLFSRSRSESRERSYPRSRYHTRTKSRSHSRSKESEDRHQSASSENIRSLDPDQQDIYSRSRSGSREHSYPRSRYYSGSISGSHSKLRNESGDRYQSASSEKRSFDPDQQNTYSEFRSRSGSRERSYPMSIHHTGTRSKLRNESGDRHQSSSSEQVHSRDPDHQNIHPRHRSRSVSKERSYSRSEYHTGTRRRSHSRQRNESGDWHQSSSSEKVRSRYPDQQNIHPRHRSRSVSKERSYSRSEYHSRQRYESGDGHQSAQPRYRTHSKAFSSQHFHVSSHRSKPYMSKHNYNHHHKQFGDRPSYHSRFDPS